MADDDDRQPPQAYDTVAPAGRRGDHDQSACPQGLWQGLFFTGDEGLIDVAMDEMHPDVL